MHKKYKVSLILSMIGSSLAFVFAFLGLIFLSVYEIYANALNIFLNTSVSSDGTTLLQMLNELGILVEDFALGFYIFTIIMNIFTVLLAIPCVVLTIISFNNINLSPVEFQKKSKLHIWRLISVGLAIESISMEMLSYIESSLSTISTLVNAALIVSLVFGIISLVENNKVVKKINSKVTQAEIHPTYNEVINNEIIDVKEDKVEEVKEEPKIIEQAKLDEMYDLLSKLEKSYKSGEMTYEDYERMKKTILDNYLK